MLNFVLILLSVVTTAGVGGTLYFYNEKKSAEKKLKDKKFIKLTEEEAISKASDKARIKLLEAQKQAENYKLDAEKKIKQMYSRIDESEKRLNEREKKIISREKTLDDRFDTLEKKERSLEQAKSDVKNLRSQIQSKLEKIASMTREEAEKELKSQVEEDLNDFIAKKIKEAEYEIKATSDDRAKEILIDVMQKSATDYVAESTSTTIEIPGEEVKGKIIGKDGRNIRTFERLTGVDIIIDEAPDQVSLSSFDPIRREVAAVALQRLLADGRVHPGTIEETIKKVKTEIAKVIRQTGEEVAYKSGFPDMPAELVKLIGRFKYRFSYGQNLVKHSLEMVNLGAQLASEVGADVTLTKKACLLHDIGKVLVHEIEGKPHHHISGDIVRRYLKDEKLANAVESHHGDIEPKSVEAVLVMIADAISGARPGARKDNYEDYVKRIKALEDIANQYSEVKEAYAIHAGREIRVIINPATATDEDAKILAHKIAKEIEDTQNYPGVVKVTAIREYRVENEAK